MTQLRKYQITGARFLSESSKHKGLLLADEMGLGKTAQAIAACDRLNATSVLVLCPASVVENWKREFDKWSLGQPWITVKSYDKALRDFKKGYPKPFDVLICDEAHYLKNPKAKRTKMVFGAKCDGHGLCYLAKRIMLLTGTPMPNNPSELWPMLRALAPEAIKNPKADRPYSFWPFAQKFCKIMHTPFGMQIKGAKNHRELSSKLSSFMLRRTKAEAAPDMPPISYGPLYIKAEIKTDGECAEEARRVRRVLKEKGVEGLQEIAPHVATLRRYTGMAKVEPIVNWIDTWFDCGGGKLVVFAHHREVLNKLNASLAAYNPVMIAGSMKTQERQHAVDTFQERDDCLLFLGQVQAAGEGITLTASSDVVFVEPSWVPKDNAQAAMRVHRLGQTKPCVVRYATVAGSLDDVIQNAIVRKTADIQKILEPVLKKENVRVDDRRPHP